MEKSLVPPGATMVVLPHTSKGGFAPATVSSLVYGIIYNGLPQCGFHFLGDYAITQARNAAAAESIRMGYEWLFFVDSDMDFPVGTLERLKKCDADIACTDMWSRNWPSFRTVLKYGKKEKGKLVLYPVDDETAKKGQVERIDCCGMACTLIRVDLFRKFAKKKILPFSTGIHGEDASFCMLATQKFKATIKCDMGIVSGHWGVSRNVGQEFTRDARNQPGAVADPEFLKRMGARNIGGAT